MKHTTIKIIAFSAVCVVGWQLGGMMPSHTMTVFFGFIFGSFVGIPAMLIIATRAQTVRHDHYVHTMQLTAKPTRHIVIANRPALPTSTHNKIEVKR